MFENQFLPSLLLDELPDLVLLTDEEGIIRYANHRSRELLQEKHLLGSSFLDLVHPLDLKWFPKFPQDWMALQSDGDTAWEVRLAIEEQPRLASGKAKPISLPVCSATTDLPTTFEGILIVLRLVGKSSQQVRRNLLLKAIESADSSIVVADMLQDDSPLSYVNQGFLSTTGYEASEVLGQNCRLLQSPGPFLFNGDSDENHESLEQIRKAIAAGERTCVTLKNYRKDGTPFYNELHLTPVYENEQLAAYVGIQNDVTERVRSQQQLLERERTLSSFLSAAEPIMGIVEFSQAAFSDAEPSRINFSQPEAIRHILTNANHKNIVSSKDESTPQSHADFMFASLGIEAEARSQWETALTQCLQTQKAIRLEYEIVRQQQRRHFRAIVNPVTTEPEAAMRCCYITEDVTDLVEAEKKRFLMEAAVENMNESVVITTPELDNGGPKIIYVNQAFTRITGYTAAEAIGQTPRMLQGELTNPSVLTRLKEGLLTNRHFKGEVINYRKDSEPFVIEWTIAPITNSKDQVIYWVAAQQNVTRRRQLEKEVLDSQTHEQARIARDLHDSVQQRLSVTAGLAQIVRLKLGKQITLEVEELLNKLFESSKQAAIEVRAITHGLQSIGRSKDALMRALQQLATTTQDVLKTNCEFTYEQPVLIQNREIADHLYRLTQEAVNNAIRHGNAKNILIGLSRQAPNRYTLTISDDGCGISAAALDSKQGGIGLNSMRYRAEMIGGEFAIAPDSRGRGTIVTCTFACESAASKQSRSAADLSETL